MTVQPQYHWQFTERQGTIVNTVSGTQSRLFKAALKGHGRIGNAVHLQSKDSHINLGKEVGQFGTNDFTVAFGMRHISRHGDKELDIIGSQAMKGHGNFFSVRLSDGRIFFHVDENSKAKHYVRVQTSRLSMVSNRIWFHVAVVRKGKRIKIYIDGVLEAEAESKTGVANINNNVDVKLGHSRRGTPNAQYEDLRIYHTALSASEIEALLPPVNRTLRPGEIELVATDKASIILNQDVKDLSQYSEKFQKLRLGPSTGATLYTGSNFGSVAQKLYADLPDIRHTKLGTFPRSVHIWSSSDEPFIGKWIIKAPNDQYLSRRGSSLVTAPHRLLNELFVFHYNVNHDQAQLIPATEQERLLLKVEDKAAVLLVDDSETHKDEFSIVSPSRDQWLTLDQKGALIWTQSREDRSVFCRAAKMADHEGQVGELSPGEVALYEHVAYTGRTWVLSDGEHDVAGDYTSLKSFHGLDNVISSIRLGPNTGVTLFANDQQAVTDAKRETDIEDIVDNVPNLIKSQIGNDTISALKIFKTIEPENVFASYTTRLSQDYRMVDNQLEEFSSYRTTLRFEPNAGKVEVSATDLTQIEVEGTTYEIDETRSVTLSPNELNFIMITSEADGLNTPGLKIRTQEMALNEHVVIFPNQEAHQQIAEMEDDALWNATDVQGNLIVDRKAHTKEEVANVQNTIKRMMATVTYAETDSVTGNRSVTDNHSTPVRSSTQSISGATIEDHPWELKLGGVDDSPNIQGLQSGAALVQTKSLTSGVTKTGIEEEISQDEFTRLLGQSTRSKEVAPPVPSKGFGTTNLVASRSLFGSIGKGLKNTIKKAKSVVVGAVKGVVHVLVKTVEGVIDFVVDTVKKVAEFIEAVVETVVRGIKKFIEFLQFLFNWDDILETQRYLVRVFNSGLNSATQLAEDAKPGVSAFVDDLQDSVEDGMNALVRELGGKPSEVRKSGFELPEAFEWFLSKILSGSKQTGANLVVGSGGDPSEDSILEIFLSNFLEALEDAIGAGLRVSEGLFESLQALISNPRQPQRALVAIIEALRDAIIQSLDAAETVALGLLDIVKEAVKQLQNLLNAEIKIPFISELFKLLGAGKLTILNLSSLLLAIPVTVISKIVTKEKPFTSSALPLDLSTPVQARLLVTTEQKTEADDDNADDTVDDLRKEQTFTLIAMTADSVNHIINGLLDLFDKPNVRKKSGSESSDANSTISSEDTFANKGRPKISTVVEFTSIVLSGISFLVSYPFDSEADSKEAKREKILWDVRAAALMADTAAVLTGEQRMRRLQVSTTMAWGLYSVVDMILFSMYLAAVEEDNKAIKNADIIAEVFAWLPNVSCIVREIPLPEPAATIVHVGHAATNAVAAVATLATGAVLVNEGDKALKEAGASA